MWLILFFFNLEKWRKKSLKITFLFCFLAFLKIELPRKFAPNKKALGLLKLSQF
jgi:hypothetical protein